jgi:hypothetical protein
MPNMDLKLTFIIYAASNGHDIYKKQRGPNKDANDRGNRTPYRLYTVDLSYTSQIFLFFFSIKEALAHVNLITGMHMTDPSHPNSRPPV